MRRFAWCLMLVGVCALGCDQPAETIPSVAPSSGGTADGEAAHEHAEGEDHDHAEEGASTAKVEKLRFVADKRLSVPDMMCPYSCWPKVQETLAAQPGVEAVQLAEQPAGTPEGEIVEKVVELKLNGDFDADAAIAALEKVSFEAAIAE